MALRFRRSINLFPGARLNWAGRATAFRSELGERDTRPGHRAGGLQLVFQAQASHLLSRSGRPAEHFEHMFSSMSLHF